jgi:hypothetical protein
MIEQNMRNGNLPLMNLHESLFNYYGEGRDMFLPYFKIDHGEVIIDGLALLECWCPSPALGDAVAAFNPTERIKGKTIIRVCP